MHDDFASTEIGMGRPKCKMIYTPFAVAALTRP
jgi:hypothetical protein